MKGLLPMILLCFGFASSANILALFPMPFSSHVLNFKPLFVELANRGHNVTFIGNLVLPETKNLKQITVNDKKIDDILGIFLPAIRKVGGYGFITYFWYYGSELANIALDHPAFQELIKDESSHYDLIIMEPYFLQEPLVAFGWKFNCPIVGIFPMNPSIWASYLSGNPMPFSYVPSYKQVLSDHMTLSERIQNTLYQLYEFLGSKFYLLPIQEEVMRKKMVFKGSENLPPLQDLLQNVSLHLIDYHFSSGYNRPFENNIVQAGGLTLARAKLEPLDKKLTDLVEKSEGVIFFSLGGLMKTSDLGETSVRELMKAFARLDKFLILMKWNDEAPPPGQPSNVVTSKWFPQPTILSHPKIKIMIGHGGIHGIMESIHNSVPFIGIPAFADQEYNMRFVEAAGFGLRLGRDELTADNILRAVSDLLTDPKYKENAQKRSLMSRDRIADPLDQAVYSVEYVIRQKGAPHLRPAVVDLWWYQYLLLDVIAVLVIIPLMVIVLTWKWAKWTRRGTCPIPPAQNSKSRK